MYFYKSLYFVCRQLQLVHRFFSRIKFNPFKTKINPYYIKGFSSHHATNTLHVGYRGQSANADTAKQAPSFRDPHKTQTYIQWAEFIIFESKHSTSNNHRVLKVSLLFVTTSITQSPESTVRNTTVSVKNSNYANSCPL